MEYLKAQRFIFINIIVLVQFYMHSIILEI